MVVGLREVNFVEFWGEDMSNYSTNPNSEKGENRGRRIPNKQKAIMMIMTMMMTWQFSLTFCGRPQTHLSHQ